MEKNRAAYNQIQVHNQSVQNKQQVQNQTTLSVTNLVPSVLPHIKKVQAEYLRIQGQKRPQLLRQICHIYFPFLTYLNLRESEIINIECIRYLECPVLVTLQLCQNHITNMKPLIKNNCMNKLKCLTFYGNPIKQKWPVQRQNMPELTQYEPDATKQQCTIEDLSFLSKNSGIKIKKLYGNSLVRIEERIKQNKVLQAFTRCNHNIEIR